jgi:hypothetical protein
MLSKTRVWKSPLHDVIYAGKIHKNGKTVISKEDVTDEVIFSILDYIKPGNILTAESNNGKKYEIEVREVTDAG